MLRFAIIFLTFSSTGLLAYQYVPAFIDKIQRAQGIRLEKATKKIDSIYLRARVKRMAIIYTAIPLVLGVSGLILVQGLVGLLAGVGVGLVLPAFVIQSMDSHRKGKFQSQLIDALMLLSSSLKGGLSLIQSIENLVAEMPAPISEEFNIVLAENKMGIPLEESFKNLNSRIPSAELNMAITAILLARDTGGNLPDIFSKVVLTIKEKNKITQQVKTLTLQGKIQGTIMSFLPIGFSIFVFTFNPKFFDIMFSSEVGRRLLIYALCSQIVGIFLIQRISKIKI